MNWRSKALSLTIALASSVATPVWAADCISATCVSVSTDPVAGGILITATHNAPGKSTPQQKQPIKRSTVRKSAPVVKKPRTWIPWKPVTVRKVVRTTSKPRPMPKPAVAIPASSVAAVSLSDSITQLLPGRGIAFAPSPRAIAQVPVRFSTTTDQLFHTTAKILDVFVGVDLHPAFFWDFGDGAISTKQNPTHTFALPGKYTTGLTVSWDGTWSAGLFTYPVLGNVILQRYQTTVEVGQGPTRFGA